MPGRPKGCESAHAFQWEHSHTLLESAQQATVIFWADSASAHLREGDAHGEGEREDHAQREHSLVERVGAAWPRAVGPLRRALLYFSGVYPYNI